MQNKIDWATMTVTYIIIYKMSFSESKNKRSYTMGSAHSKQFACALNEQPWKRTSKIKTSPSATFGKTQRSSDQKKVVPGPGAYELNKSTMEKGLISFKGNKRIRFNTDSPGPGAYQPVVKFSTKQYSFQKSQFHQKQEVKPSPVTYNIRQLRHQGLSFSKQQRNLTPQKEKIANPGPGNYASNKLFSHKHEFSFTKTKKFFQSQQEDEQKVKTPGPGSYELSKTRTLTKASKFTRALRSFLEDDKIPGPGSYQTQKTSLEHLGGVMTCQKRKFQYDNHIPGPGSYKDVAIQLIKKKQGAASIGKSRQSSADSKRNIPGPGSYLIDKIRQDKILGGVIGRDERGNNHQIIAPQISMNRSEVLADHHQNNKPKTSNNHIRIKQNLTQHRREKSVGVNGNFQNSARAEN